MKRQNSVISITSNFNESDFSNTGTETPMTNYTDQVQDQAAFGEEIETPTEEEFYAVKLQSKYGLIKEK